MPKANTIKSYKDLDVWMMAMSLAESCLSGHSEFPARGDVWDDLPDPQSIHIDPCKHR